MNSSRRRSPRPGQSWLLPASPAWTVLAGRSAVAAMAGLALFWWGTLVFDAAQGRSSWLVSVLAAGGLLSWAVLLFRGEPWLRAQPERRVQWGFIPPIDAADAALAAPSGPFRPFSPWSDEDGKPLDIHVAMDLGAGMLLRLQPVGAAGRKAGKAQWRWVGALALEGPWRWRVIAGSRAGTMAAPVQMDAPVVASWALFESRKSALPKSARRSA